jgi:hypothetical protein
MDGRSKLILNSNTPTGDFRLQKGWPVVDKRRGSELNRSQVKAQWYDPRDGTWRMIGQYPNKGIQEFVTPSHGEKDDWVLVLDASYEDERNSGFTVYRDVSIGEQFRSCCFLVRR